MTPTEAAVYLRIARALPASALLFGLGLMVATLGVPLLGLPLLACGTLGWVLTVTAAAFRAARHRGNKPWVGPRSVSEETNELLGWSRLEEAASALGSDADVRFQVRAMTAGAAGALVVSAATILLRSA